MRQVTGFEEMRDAQEIEGPWKCIKVVGPMQLSAPSPS